MPGPIKPKYFYSNKSTKQTIGDTYELVTAFGATMFGTIKDEKNGRVGVAFKWKDQSIQMCLEPHKILAVLQSLKGITAAQKTPEKAERMAFRLIYHWLANNFQLVTWQAMSIPEVFFAHCLMEDGHTVADHFIKDGEIKELPMPAVDVEFKEEKR